MAGTRRAKIKPLGITATGEYYLRSGSAAATPLIGNIEHAFTGSTVEGTRFVCDKAHIALRAMENHPSILNCIKEKERSHHLGHLPIVHSTAKEKQAKATVVVWVSVEKEREREEREASSC
jgi:hypothetical protein